VVNTVMEFWVATMPLLATFSLGVRKEQRWSVISILCLGYFTVIGGVVRTYYIFKAVHTYDYTWWSGPQWIASEVEIDMALVSFPTTVCPERTNMYKICACAAPLRPLMSRLTRGTKTITDPNHHSLDGGTETDSGIPQPKNYRSGSVATTKMSISQDPDGINEWTQTMSRTIDLEGIAPDGFGYTVTISGPSGPVQTNPSNRAIGLFQLPWRRSSVAPQDEPMDEALTMRKQTEVSVQQTWQSTSFDTSYSSRRYRSRLNSLSPASLDDMTFESMGLRMNGLLDDDVPEVRRPASSSMVHPLGGHPVGDYTPRVSAHPPPHLQRHRSLSLEDDEDLPARPQLATIWRNSFDSATTPPIGEISWFGDVPSRKHYSR
jgi:hypothetical protein